MNKKLKKARDKVDQLDNKIFILIKKRTNVVKQMLKLKKYKKILKISSGAKHFFLQTQMLVLL